MIQIKPKLKIENLVPEILEMFQNRVLNEIKIQRHRSSVLKLIKDSAPDQASNYVALGVLDALQNKKDNAYKNLENAISLSPREHRVRLVYSDVCSKFGDSRRAMELIMECSPASTGQKTLLECAIIRCNLAAHHSLSLELIQQYQAITVNEPHHFKPAMIEQLKLVRERIQSSGYSEEDMLLRLEVAVDAVSSEYVVEQTSKLILRNGTYIHQIYIDADVDVCAEMNFKIADAIVEKFPSDASDIATFMCRPIAFLDNLQKVMQ
ncbi:tetratricopeptide repeat protein [Undibacterium sp. MH2W]|uniref:tetratricopeptide repeat protein n=1 Tax=Undibacterium sp. MH2W TaxID=3413044 RepID=UPI003BEFC23E